MSYFVYPKKTKTKQSKNKNKNAITKVFCLFHPWRLTGVVSSNLDQGKVYITSM